MADVRPFRALRYEPAKVDAAVAIAPPYDVISAEQQRALYERSAYNVVRVEYGEQRADDTPSDDRYSRAARDVAAWRRAGVLVREREPALYRYEQRFEREGLPYTRTAFFCLVRLEEWEKRVIKPHEHTLSGPKQDRLALLRATRMQVSPVYSLYRTPTGSAPLPDAPASPLYDFEADGERHTLAAVTDVRAVEAFRALLADSDVYIADGHHRYETALVYRDECRGRASTWSGEEPENFVLMALGDVADPGLLVLPTHRLVSPRSSPADVLAPLAEHFSVEEVDVAAARASSRMAWSGDSRFYAFGPLPGAMHRLTLRDRPGVEAMMPADQPAAWKRLDVNVLQYGVLQPLFGIDDAVLAAGRVVAYTQDQMEAMEAVTSGRAHVAFLLGATPVAQVLAVADAGGRMPQKSTYFYPKLPTGLVMNALE